VRRLSLLALDGEIREQVKKAVDAFVELQSLRGELVTRAERQMSEAVGLLAVVQDSIAARIRSLYARR
jgi:hypothetical protein